MGETKLTGKSMEERIADRLKSSCDYSSADVYSHQGEGPTRVHTAIHHGGTARQHGEGRFGEDINGNQRGQV
jgi:hypothetical protein